MPNQPKKNSLPEDSLLNPVGKVLCQAQAATGGMIGIAQVDLALAPVGSVLYVQPSEGRLTCEVEVANANALHWKAGLEQAHIRVAELRTVKYQLRALLRSTILFLEAGDDEDFEHNKRVLLEHIHKELG